MVDYSFASEIKFVPTLYLSASSFEYYDWEDAMEYFLWDRGLESRMKLFFAWCTFSTSVLQWWIKLQQVLINRGKDPCRTWKGMKLMLQRRFDPPLKAKKKIAVVDGTKFLDTKQIARSSWSDSIVGNECLEVTIQQFVTIKYSNKKKVADGADQNKKSMNAAKFSSSKQCEKSSAIASTEIFSPCKEDRNNYSTAAIEVTKNVTQHAEIFCTYVEQVVQSSCDASTKHHVDPIHDASNGLSILAQGIQSNGTAVQVKGQRSNIFQSQC
jgi:hypothetical protein